jgi:hypothetical protein
MAFKMKASPAKRGAIEGVGPNSPLNQGTLIKKGVNLALKYGDDFYKWVTGASKTVSKSKSLTNVKGAGGVNIPTTIQQGGKTILNPNHPSYITFRSNQLKSIDKVRKARTIKP